MRVLLGTFLLTYSPCLRAEIREPETRRSTRRKNSIRTHGGFTQQDVQVLQALASHISVALQSLDAEEDAERGLKDTIRTLKETGGSAGSRGLPMGYRERRPLHMD